MSGWAVTLVFSPVIFESADLLSCLTDEKTNAQWQIAAKQKHILLYWHNSMLLFSKKGILGRAIFQGNKNY